VDKLIGVLFSYWKKTGKLCITGGEPLLQMKQVEQLLPFFSNVWVETNGTIDFTRIVGRCGIVADVKFQYMPESFSCFYKLKETDFVKFVVATPSQVKEGLTIQRRLQLGGCKASFAYSPEHGVFSFQRLFNTLEQYLLPKTIINAQIHKYVGMN
jgi:organic radical activating enzyme